PSLVPVDEFLFCFCIGVEGKTLSQISWDFLTKKGLDTRATGTANVRSLGDPRMHANGNALPVEQRTVQLAGPEGTRLHFSGPPSELTGTIPLVNTGPDKQKIRTVAVNTEKLQGPARLPLSEFGLNARLYGGTQANVPAMIVLNSQTPPGRYDFEVTVGGRSLPARAYVSEVV